MAHNLSRPREPLPTRWTAINSAGYESPAALAVDVVVLAVREDELQVVVLDGDANYAVLPGGFVAPGEPAEETAARVLREKVGLGDLYLEQLATFTDPRRDSRGWIPSVAFVALVPPGTHPSDPVARWVSAKRPPELGFDHPAILGAAVERVRGKLWWSNIAVGLLPREFTMSEARTAYEAIAGATYDPSTFARDLRATGLVTPTGELQHTRGRPAALYRFTDTSLTWGAGRKKRVIS